MADVFDDLFLSVYRYLGFGLLFAAVVMIACPMYRRKGSKTAITDLFIKLNSDRRYLYRFIIFSYLSMVLSRTLNYRNIWQVIWVNIIGEWRSYISEDENNLEGLVNLFLFVPLTTFGLLSGFKTLEGILRTANGQRHRTTGRQKGGAKQGSSMCNE